MTKSRPVHRRFTCPVSEKTGTVFKEISTGDVPARVERAALLKALRIERNRPMRRQRVN